VIVLDTHAMLWWTEEADLLGPRSREMAGQADAERQLAISAASIWEVALLVSRGRLKLKLTIPEFRKRLLDAGVLELAIDGQIAIDAVALDLPHRDPFDRIIVASAIAHNATMLTADRQILALAACPSETGCDPIASQ
jgi:PIN domain nuclease of toxin-antitoxin system